MWKFDLKSFMHDLKTHKDATVPTVHRPCDAPGCAETGHYKAPRSRDTLNEYYWFCLEHVQEYNSKWDYFKGMSASEIQEQIHNTTTWDRPTWRMSEAGLYEEQARQKIYEHFANGGSIHGDFGADSQGSETNFNFSDLPQPMAEALHVLDLEPPLDWERIKNRYKELTKKYHPDANRDNPEAEEKFKEITLSFNIIKLSYQHYLQLPDTRDEKS